MGYVIGPLFTYRTGTRANHVVFFACSRGLWNVPFIGNSYVINATLLKKYDRSKLNYAKDNLDADMAFCANLRDLDVFLYVSNRVDFGHLVNPETYDVTRTEPEMYQIFDNERDWEDRFIHEEYPESFNPDKKNAQVTSSSPIT